MQPPALVHPMLSHPSLQRPAAVQTGTGGAVVAAFRRDFSTLPALGENYAFTRATARWVKVRDLESESPRLAEIPAGMLPIGNGRLVHNLFTDTTSSLASGSATTAVSVAAGTYIFSMGAGSGTATFSGTATGSTGTLDADASQRKRAVLTITVAGTIIVTASVADLADIMLEDSTGRGDTTTPSEYVSVGVGTGDEYIPSAGFDDWADPAIPDGWETVGTHNATNYVAEHADGLTLVSDGAYIGIKITDADSFDGTRKWAWTITVDSATSSIKLQDNNGAFELNITAGTYSGIDALDGKIEIARQATATTAVISNISVKLCDPGNVNADGRQYYAYENGNSVDANGVVTAGTGTALSGVGYAYEPLSINKIIWSSDLSNAAWIKRGTLTATLSSDGTYTEVRGLEITAAAGDVYQTGISFGIGVRNEPSCYLRAVSTSGTIQINNAAGLGYGQWRVDLSLVSSTEFERITRDHASVTITTEFVGKATSGNSGFLVKAFIGSNLDVDIKYAQLEEGEVSTGVIPTESVAKQRHADELVYTQTTPQAQGMLIVKTRQYYPSTGTNTGQIVSFQIAGNDVMYHNADSDKLTSWDGTTGCGTVFGAYTQGDLITMAMRWSGSEYQSGALVEGGAWQWGVVKAYDAGWPSDDVLRLDGMDAGQGYDDIALYDVDKGTDWIEANYS